MTKYIMLFLILSSAWADANEGSIFAEIARLRQYPSGADECDLKVRPVLPSKKKKLIKPEPTEGF